MTVAELLKKLEGVPADTNVVLDLGVDTFLEVSAEVVMVELNYARESREIWGVRLTFDRTDKETARWAAEIGAFPHLPG